MKIQEMSKSLRRQWRKRLRNEWGINPMPFNAFDPRESVAGRWLDDGNGTLCSVSPTGLLEGFEYDVAASRVNEPAWIRCFKW